MLLTTHQLLLWVPIGYLFSICVETPVLLLCLSRRHPLRHRLYAGIWLTACTYPIVVLVMYPWLMPTSEALYLWVAETFAPGAECLLFWLAFGKREELGTDSFKCDMLAVVLANLASFGLGEIEPFKGWLNQLAALL
jgi:hypothetical protein